MQNAREFKSAGPHRHWFKTGSVKFQMIYFRTSIPLRSRCPLITDTAQSVSLISCTELCSFLFPSFLLHPFKAYMVLKLDTRSNAEVHSGFEVLRTCCQKLLNAGYFGRPRIRWEGSYGHDNEPSGYIKGGEFYHAMYKYSARWAKLKKKWQISIWASCKVWVIMNRHEPKLNLGDNFWSIPLIPHLI